MSTNVPVAIGQNASGTSKPQLSHRRVWTIIAALIGVAAANVYFLKPFEAPRSAPGATGWSIFQLEAQPPPIYATGSVRSRRSHISEEAVLQVGRCSNRWRLAR